MKIFQQLIDVWASRDVDQFTQLFSPSSTWIVDGQPYEGRDAIAQCMRSLLADVAQVRVVMRRSFSDLEDTNWCVAEWAFRTQRHDQAQTQNACSEVEQAVLMHVREDDGKIDVMRTHNDSFRCCTTELNAPVRPEHRPATYPTPARLMSKADILALQHRHVMQGWRLGDANQVCSCHAPDTVILNAWEVVQGHAEIRTSAAQYIANFADTHIEVHRIVYDGQNIAVNQTWSCTNRLTGKRAGDQDLIIGVVQDGQIHYWREYFDPNQSAQTLSQTHFGVLQRS